MVIVWLVGFGWFVVDGAGLDWLSFDPINFGLGWTWLGWVKLNLVKLD